jgi:signal transduction histidine kinase
LIKGFINLEIFLETTTDHADVIEAQLQAPTQILELNNAALQQINKLKDEFLANTSHELRTHLHGIIGIAESLIDGATGPMPEKTIANLEMIVSSGKRLASLVNDILDFAKLKHEPIDLQIHPVELRSLVQVVLELSQREHLKNVKRLICAPILHPTPCTQHLTPTKRGNCKYEMHLID